MYCVRGCLDIAIGDDMAWKIYQFSPSGSRVFSFFLFSPWVLLTLQDAWEDVDPDELSYEVNLIYIKVCAVLPILPVIFCLMF